MPRVVVMTVMATEFKKTGSTTNADNPARFLLLVQTEHRSSHCSIGNARVVGGLNVVTYASASSAELHGSLSK